MSSNYYDELYFKTEDGLRQIASGEKEPLKKLTASLLIIRKTLDELKKHVLSNPFKEKKEEIYFFKKIKPGFYSLLIFEIEHYRLVNYLPSGSKEQLTVYYLEELKYIDRFFLQNQFQYEYFRLDATELDHLYFLRGAEKQSVLVPEIPETDPEFSTSCAYLFSKFKAYEMLRHHLLNELDNINKADKNTFIRSGRKYKPPSWTGDIINATDLGDSLWVSNQLNSRNAELTDIMHWLSTSSNVDLTRYMRLFLEIRDRKLISKTRFIDLMRDAINIRIPSPLGMYCPISLLLGTCLQFSARPFLYLVFQW